MKVCPLELHENGTFWEKLNFDGVSYCPTRCSVHSFSRRYVYIRASQPKRPFKHEGKFLWKILASLNHSSVNQVKYCLVAFGLTILRQMTVYSFLVIRIMKMSPKSVRDSEFGQCASQRGMRGMRAMAASHARHASNASHAPESKC